MEYLKSDEPIINKNSKVTRFNVAREDKIVCLICKKPGHATEKCFHLSRAQEAVPNKQQNFLYPNQQRCNNFNGQKSTDNNFARNNYNNFPNNNFLRNKNYNFDNNNNHSLENRNKNYRNNNFLLCGTEKAPRLAGSGTREMPLLTVSPAAPAAVWPSAVRRYVAKAKAAEAPAHLLSPADSVADPPELDVGCFQHLQRPCLLRKHICLPVSSIGCLT